MQSGRGRSKLWRLEFEQDKAREIEPLMGWTSSGDTRQQVRLWFDTKEEAIAYAEKAGLPYLVSESKKPVQKILSYSDNFKWGRVGQWTH